MLILSVLLMLVATVAGIHVAASRPRDFTLFLLPVGVFEFGSELENAGGLASTCAIWLLLLIAVSLLVMWKLLSEGTKLNAPETIYLMFLGWCALETFRASERDYALRSFLRLFFPFASMYIARRTMRDAPRAERLLRYQYPATFAASTLHWGTALLPTAFYPIANLGVFWFGAVFLDHATIMSFLALARWKIKGDVRSLIFAILLAMLCFFATNRTTLLAIVVGGSVFSLLEFRKLAVVLLPTLYLSLGAAVMLVPSIRQKMFFNPDSVRGSVLLSADVLSNQQFNDDGRYAMWTEVLDRFFWPSPLLGSGLGATQAWFYSGAAKEVLHTKIKVEHSEYVKLAADTGVVGLGLYVAMHLSAWALALRAYRRARTDAARIFSVAALCGLPVFWVCMAFDNALLYVLPVAQFPTAFAAMASSLSFASSNEPAPISPGPKVDTHLLPRRRPGQRFAVAN